MHNEIISPLLKEGLPFEWLMKTDIKKVFLKFLQLDKRVLVENARFWFRQNLQEIERKATEKIESKDTKGQTVYTDPSPEQVEKRKKMLFREYFRKEKPKDEKNI